jgi:hypothetical protein
MELPADLFKRIVDHLPAAEPDQRRRCARKRHAAWVGATIPAGDQHVSAMVWNISAGGAGVLLQHQVAVDERLVLHLPHSDLGQLDLLCRIAHVRPRPDGLFILGLQFDRIMNL